MRLGPTGRAALVLLLGWSGSGMAGTEEFSTFSVYEQQHDDESLLDHLLTRTPVDWRASRERSSQSLRSSQGCLTSGRWLIDTQLKVRAPLGDRAAFGLDVRDEQSDVVSVQYFDFSFRFPTAHGTPGLLYRPLFDKSRQDLGVFWEFGAETLDVVRLTFTFEDVFNNLWAFRQTAVGNESEPYEQHPYEPALWMRVARPAGRVELGAQWLTPSRKRFETFDPALSRQATLWGALGFATVEAQRGRTALELGSAMRHAHSGLTPPGGSLYGGDYRRQWSVESALKQGLGPASALELRWMYRESFEESDAPYPSRRLSTIDRVIQLEARTNLGRFGARAGGLYDRITVDLQGDPLSAYPTRNESRAYLGFSARFGRVLLDIVEGFELDAEPYDVWGLHDKAFAHLQTTF
ncbi:MAG TPA: hypothetical protein VFQ05_07790 [Candidatus Eisenbacteria bacterium]|nr:hypothetical protein [Candidatus Eisenbacteria bacterium]